MLDTIDAEMVPDLSSKIRHRIENSEACIGSSDPKTVFVDEVWPTLQRDYDTMRAELDAFCTSRLQSLGIRCEVSSRTKMRDSIEKSLQRREEALETGGRFASLAQVLGAVHDLVGLRIVLDYPDDFQKATKFISDAFHKERDPTTFLPDREIGVWRSWFGAYQTVNHRLSLQKSNLETLSNSDTSTLLQFCGVLFEIQLTTFEENLYNQIAHPLLYKKSSGQLTLQEEQVLDMAHGAARFYTLCKVFLKNKLHETPEPADQGQIVQGTKGFVRILAEHIPGGPTGGFESPPDNCNTIEDLKGWLNTRLEDVFGKLENMNSPSSLRYRVQWDEAPFIVPYSSNPDFIGRTEILEKLKVQLGHTKGEDAARRTSQGRAGIYGLGGIGKTQIALQYIYWLRDEYPDVSVFWVHASTAQRFSEAYASIAQACNIPGCDSPDADVPTLVKKWLQTRNGHRWMMVIDNADDAELFTPSGGLQKHIPDYTYGSVLVTTRNKVVGSRLVPARLLIEVGNMDETESRNLLQQSLQLDDTDTIILSELSSRLEHLPLALAQAAAFIQENTMSVQEYIELLDGSNESQVKLLNEEFETVGRDSESSRAVAKTWILSFEQIKSQNPLAGNLLSFLSLFDRQEIPMEFVNEYISSPKAMSQPKDISQPKTINQSNAINSPKAISRPKDTRQQQDASQLPDISQLTSKSSKKKRWLPRLVRAIKIKSSSSSDFNIKLQSYREQGGEVDLNEEQAEEVELNGEPAVEVESHAEPIGGLERTKALGALKAFSFITQGKDGNFNMHRLVQLVTRNWLKQNGTMPRFAEQAIFAVAEAYPYGKHENRVKCGKYLPHVYAVLGLTGTESTQENVAKSDILHCAGSFLWYRGQVADAEKLQREGVDLREKFLGHDDEKTLASMGNLALIYKDLGRWKEAESLQSRALKVEKRVLGEEHPDTLTSMSNLASTYSDLGRWEEAESLESQVLEARKRVLGEEHPDTLTSMNNLALTYKDLGRWKEAESLQSQVLEARKRVLGEEHPDTLKSMNNLASTYKDLGRWKEAESLQSQVLEARKRVSGEEHPDTLTSMSNLALTYLNLGRWEEAESLQSQVLEARKRVSGEEHPDTLKAMNNLAVTWWKQGRHDDAKRLMERGLELREKVIGPEHPDTVASRDWLAIWMKEEHTKRSTNSSAEEEDE